jgi:hypothetical protein
MLGPICAANRIRESVYLVSLCRGSSAAALAVTRCVRVTQRYAQVRLLTVLFNNKYYMKTTAKVKRILKEILSIFVVSSLVLKKIPGFRKI